MHICNASLQLNSVNLDFIFVEIDACDPNPCQNGGICDYLAGNFTCTCSDGYEGLNCDTGNDYPFNSVTYAAAPTTFKVFLFFFVFF